MGSPLLGKSFLGCWMWHVTCDRVRACGMEEQALVLGFIVSVLKNGLVSLPGSVTFLQWLLLLPPYCYNVAKHTGFLKLWPGPAASPGFPVLQALPL